MNRHALLFLLSACTAAVTFGETVLKVDAPTEDIVFVDKDALATADRVVKTGPFKVTIKYGSTDTSSFSGEIEVQEGTLAAQYLQNFGKPSKITVLKGATLDLTSESGNAGNIASTRIYIEGNGVNDGGAIRRTGNSAINSLLGSVTLTGDALICNSVQIGFPSSSSSVINLEGHTLTIDAGIAGTDKGSVFYFPYGQFKRNGSTDDPGHVIVRGGTFFPRYEAMAGGSEKNTLTLQDNTKTLGHAKPILRLREMRTRIAWKLIVEGDGAGYIEDDGNPVSKDTENVWAGPVELKKQLTAYPWTDSSHLTLAGGVTGRCTVANAYGSNNGLLTLTGTNDIGKLVSRSGRTVFEGGKTTFSGMMDATAGSIAFKDTEAHWANKLQLYVGGKGKIASLDIDHSTVTTITNNNGGSGSRFYVGNGDGNASNLYGVVTIRNGSVVSNLAASVGYKGYGMMLVEGSDYYWPLYDSGFDSPGYYRGSYGHLAVTNSRFTVDSSFFPADDAGIYSFFGYNGTAVLTVRAGSDLKFLGSPSRTRVEFAANTGSRFSAYLEGGAKMTFRETFDFGRNSSRAQSGAADVTLTGEGTTVKVGEFMRVFWTKTDADFTLNLNDGAVLESPNLYRVGQCQMKVNLNGGVIRKTGSGWFSNRSDASDTSRLPSRVTVYEKGFAIDTSAFKDDAVAKMEYVFQAPGTGKRIASIALPTDKAFSTDTFMGPPTVRIAGGGQGATAFADYDETTRKVVGIVVTAPGWGYGDDTTVTMESGDRKKLYACVATLTDQPETGWGGFRKTGTARLNMYGANAYRGETEVTAGILGFLCPQAQAPQGGLPEGSGLVLHKGATVTFESAATPVSVPFIRGCGTTSFGCFTVTEAIDASLKDLAAGNHLTVNQKLTLGEKVKIRILEAESLAAHEGTNVQFLVLEAKGGLTVSGKPELILVEDGIERSADNWHVTMVGNKVYLRENTGMTIILR